MTHQARKLGSIPSLEYANLAKAWLFIYSILYFSAVIQGMRSEIFNPTVSAILLTLAGILSLTAIFVENRTLRILLSALWGYATIANWMKMPQWVPVYSDLQYTVMALMNMVQAICLAYLGEVWKIERT